MSSKTTPVVGDMVLYFTGGEIGHQPFPMIVTEIGLDTIRGTVFTTTQTFRTDHIRHVCNPWCVDHPEVVRKQGAWGSYADIKESQNEKTQKQNDVGDAKKKSR